MWAPAASPLLQPGGTIYALCAAGFRNLVTWIVSLNCEFRGLGADSFFGLSSSSL